MKSKSIFKLKTKTVGVLFLFILFATLIGNINHEIAQASTPPPPTSDNSSPNADPNTQSTSGRELSQSVLLNVIALDDYRLIPLKVERPRHLKLNVNHHLEAITSYMKAYPSSVSRRNVDLFIQDILSELSEKFAQNEDEVIHMSLENLEKLDIATQSLGSIWPASNETLEVLINLLSQIDQHTDETEIKKIVINRKILKIILANINKFSTSTHHFILEFERMIRLDSPLRHLFLQSVILHPSGWRAILKSIQRSNPSATPDSSWSDLSQTLALLEQIDIEHNDKLLQRLQFAFQDSQWGAVRSKIAAISHPDLLKRILGPQSPQTQYHEPPTTEDDPQVPQEMTNQAQELFCSSLLTTPQSSS